MQFTQKHIISISVVAILAILGYFAVQNTTPSQSDGVSSTGITNTTGSVLPVSLSQSGKDTVSNTELPPCNTVNPFSGSINCKKEEKSQFQKPNTEWKNRDVTLADGRVVTYRFGEGNPKEVAMDKIQIETMNKTCENNNSLAEKGICDVEHGFTYMTSEVEKHLLLALSDPNWSKLATDCENSFRARETYFTPENIAQSLSNDVNFLYFDRVFAPGFLDIDRFISVDPTTGLKILNRHLTSNLSQFVMNAMYDGASRGEVQPNPYGDCVDKYGKDIARNFVITFRLYRSPLEDQK